MGESGSSALRSIILSGRGLQSIEDLNKFIDEDDINQAALDGNQLADLTLFPSLLCNLQILNLSHNLIYTLHRKPFQNLHQLRVLDLSHNAISTIKGLEGLPLHHLDLSHNSISLMTGIGGLDQLRSLDLSFNDIEQIDDLSRNTSLELLNLASNFISVLQEISDQLPSSLQTLDLSCNWINSIQSLTFLSGMNSLKTLNCSGNPFIIAAAGGNYNYRSLICFILPSITTIDGRDPNHVEIQEGQRLFCEPGSNDLSANLLQLLDDGNDDELQAYLQSICPIELKTMSKLSENRENLDEQSSSKLITIGDNECDCSDQSAVCYDRESFLSALRSINASLSVALGSVPTSGLSRWNLKSVAAIVIQSHWRRKRIQSVYREYLRQIRRQLICNIPAHKISVQNASIMQVRLKQALEEVDILKQRLNQEYRTKNLLVENP